MKRKKKKSPPNDFTQKGTEIVSIAEPPKHSYCLYMALSLTFVAP